MDITDEKSLSQIRLERTLKLWNKLQDRIEEALGAEDISASMISSISKTLIEQFKMDKTSPERAAEALESGTSGAGVAGEEEEEEFQLPFPIDTTANHLEADLGRAAEIEEKKADSWEMGGRLQID